MLVREAGDTGGRFLFEGTVFFCGLEGKPEEKPAILEEVPQNRHPPACVKSEPPQNGGLCLFGFLNPPAKRTPSRRQTSRTQAKARHRRGTKQHPGQYITGAQGSSYASWFSFWFPFGALKYPLSWDSMLQESNTTRYAKKMVRLCVVRHLAFQKMWVVLKKQTPDVERGLHSSHSNDQPLQSIKRKTTILGRHPRHGVAMYQGCVILFQGPGAGDSTFGSLLAVAHSQSKSTFGPFGFAFWVI